MQVPLNELPVPYLDLRPNLARPNISLVFLFPRLFTQQSDISVTPCLKLVFTGAYSLKLTKNVTTLNLEGEGKNNTAIVLSSVN